MEAGFADRNEKLPLFDRLGGRVFLTLITEKFCDRMLTDPKLNEVLAQANPDRLKKRLIDLASKLVLEESGILTPELEAIGKKIRCTMSHFNRGISHLIAALVWAGVSVKLIEEVLNVVTPLSEHLVRPDNPIPSNGL